MNIVTSCAFIRCQSFDSTSETISSTSISFYVNSAQQLSSPGKANNDPTFDLLMMAMDGESFMIFDRQKEVVVICTQI